MTVVWFIVGGCVLAALIILFIVLTVLRFNQLSMARSLCDEAKRQLIGEIRARHALVPAYIGTLQQIAGQDLSGSNSRSPPPNAPPSTIAVPRPKTP